MELIDLHVHSTASDGTFPPGEVVRLAKEAGLCAFALTDHDTTAGVREAIIAGKAFDIEVIPGIELSTSRNGTEIHILGLFVDTADSYFLQELKKLAAIREQRNETMRTRFLQLGIPISVEELCMGNPDTVITRAHFARALVQKGIVTTMDQAFSRYLGNGCPCFVPRTLISPAEAVSLLLRNGAFPVLAHPMQYKLGWRQTEELICELKEAGLMGLEVYYSSHTSGQSAKLQVLAKKYDLLPTGGSDFHGSNKPDIRLGCGRGGLRVSKLLLEDISARISRL